MSPELVTLFIAVAQLAELRWSLRRQRREHKNLERRVVALEGHTA